MTYKFIKKNWHLLFILIFILTFSCVFLFSTNNITGMMHGDGWFHSIFANNIFQDGEIIYHWKYRLFHGLKIDNQTTYYPIHYTQFYHLALGLFNNVLGLSVFSKVFTIIINLLIGLYVFLIFEKHKSLRIIAPIAIILLLSSRLFFVNFMEGYLLLMFILFVFLIYKFFKTKIYIFFYFSIFFLGCLAIAKHIGLFDAILIFAILMIYLLSKKEIKKILISLLIFIVVVIPPIFSLWSSTHTIGYGVGKQVLPSFIPFHTTISDTFFNSKYKLPEDWAWRKLSYQNDKSFKLYIEKISNYFLYFSNGNYKINFLILILFFIGVIKNIKEKPKLTTILSSVFLLEFYILYKKQLIISQYNIILIFIFSFFVLYGILYFSRFIRGRTAVLVVSLLLLIFINNFFTYQSRKIYGNEGRKSFQQETLYRDLGNYISDEDTFYEKIFVASDPQFSYYSQKTYVWYQELFLGDIDKELDKIINLFNASFLVVSSKNYNNKGFYDYIPNESIKYLLENNKITLIKIFKSGSDFIELYRII